MDVVSSTRKNHSNSLSKGKASSKLKLKSFSNLHYVATEPDIVQKKKKLTLNLLKTKQMKSSKSNLKLNTQLANIKLKKNHSNNSISNSNLETLPPNKKRKDYITLLNENNDLLSQIEILKQEIITLKLENKKLLSKLNNNINVNNTINAPSSSKSNIDILHFNSSNSNSNILLTQENSYPSFLKQNSLYSGYFRFKHDSVSPTFPSLKKKKKIYLQNTYKNIPLRRGNSDCMQTLNTDYDGHSNSDITNVSNYTPVTYKDVNDMKMRMKKLLNKYSVMLEREIRYRNDDYWNLQGGNFNTIECTRKRGNSRNIK